MSEHSGVTGKSPRQVARGDSLREITNADMVRGGINDLPAYLRVGHVAGGVIAILAGGGELI